MSKIIAPTWLRHGLIVDLPMDEGAGGLCFNKVKRTNEADTARTNIVTWGQNGLLGKSLTWAAPNTNKVTIGKPSSLNLTTSEMTVSAWVRITNLSGGVNSGYRYICSDYNTGASNAQFALQVTNGQRAVFFWANAGTQSPAPLSAHGSTILAVDTLYHIVGTRGGSTGAWRSDIYLNGNRDGGTTTTGNPCTQANAGNVQVGQAGDYTGALGMVGAIKGLKIWNRALNATEIRKLYELERTKIHL